jgi:hypothetical protein
MAVRPWSGSSVMGLPLASAIHTTTQNTKS